MAKMTTRQRIKRMYEHREADRIPIFDDPWNATIERWQREGMPKDVDWIDYFDLDHVVKIFTDNSPQYEAKVVEETDEYKIYTSSWGVTIKDFKHWASSPQFLDFTIVDPDSWAKAKKRMTPTRDRINWKLLEANYKTWREKGYWIEAALWFGFDITHSWVVGTERVLMATIENPQWCMDLFETELEMSIALFEQVWEAGYHFDSIFWWDDMGYKQNQFFSLDTYRQILKPFHQRAIDWAHSKGIKAHLHSCGDIRPFIPELVDMGVDALNPLEVKAGMDTLKIKKDFGDKLVLHGGINAVNWPDRPAIEAEMREKIPVLKENGGYIFSSDHSIPSSVSLDEFRYISDLAKELGSYE